MEENQRTILILLIACDRANREHAINILSYYIINILDTNRQPADPYFTSTFKNTGTPSQRDLYSCSTKILLYFNEKPTQHKRILYSISAKK